MTEQQPNPLIQRSLDIQAAQLREQEDQERMKEILPEFRQLLGDTLAGLVPPPERVVEEVTWQVLQQDSWNRRDSHRLSVHQTRFTTSVSATLPVGEDSVSLLVGADAYPDPENAETLERINYKIDVADLDHVLLVGSEKATVQSKKRESKPFDIHSTPIGVPGRDWPAWKRAATPQDVEDYSLILKELQETGIVNKAVTPRIVERDWTNLQAEARKHDPKNVPKATE